MKLLNKILSKQPARSKYYTIVTKIGLEKIQSYSRQDRVIKLTQMGFGGIDDGAYIAPDENALFIPNEWARIDLTHKPKQGFIGGGVTLNNHNSDYVGKVASNFGIYDEDGDLILIATYRPITIDPEQSIVGAYTFRVITILDNASNIITITDTSITHPTHNDMKEALRALYVELSKYATTTKKGLTELATQTEVDQKKSGDRVVTVDTLDKPGLIKLLKEFTIATANKVEEKIYGGVPVETLDTIKEVSDALLDTGDAVSVMFDRITKLEANLTTTKLTLRKVEGKVGRVRLYMRNDIDDDYLPIRGQTIRKSDYPDYFAHLNITTETLRLPNWSTHGYIRQFSDTLAAGATLEQEILQHNHTATIGNGGGHTPTAYPIDLGSKSGVFSLNKRFWTSSNNAHSHTYTTAIGGPTHGTDPWSSSPSDSYGDKQTSTTPAHDHYVDINFSNVPVTISLGSYNVTMHTISPHTHVAHIANTGGDENRPKTTVAVYAVKVKYLTAIN
ncbi:phage tail protein [Photobacterium piscicola]|uniref:phage tail-collar fiber domain-containing protein n=1 Tax=Photobacterium piscicola TaxID=1378299 RepID=UPI0037352E94